MRTIWSGASRDIKFTLLELLTISAIMAVLISILLPALGKVKETAKSIFCLNNLKQNYIAISGYSSDNQNWAPATLYGQMWSKNLVDGNYTAFSSCYCPSYVKGKPPPPYDQTYGMNYQATYSYPANGVLGAPFQKWTYPSQTLLLGDTRHCTASKQYFMFFWGYIGGWAEGNLHGRHNLRPNVSWGDGSARSAHRKDLLAVKLINQADQNYNVIWGDY